MNYRLNVRVIRKRKRHKKFFVRKSQKKSNIYIKKNIKLISILFSIILIFYTFYINPEDLKNLFSFKNEMNNNWLYNLNNLINYYLSNYKKTASDIKESIKPKRNLLSLIVLSKDENSSYNIEAKKKLRYTLEKLFNKDLNKIKNIFIKAPFFFGNQIVALNNLIYYSEILGIKNIYFNSEYDFYIKNDIYTNKIHISLKQKKEINCSSPETICCNLYNDFFYPQVIKPKRRSLILKNEIKRNLPKINVKKNDLYIYIRSGDNFNKNGNQYSPAPYCFYQKILSRFKFKDIYILSIDDKSPIIKKLLLDYPKIKHKLNPVKLDIALLISAYNIVNSVSSFSQAAISLNDNLINLFDYQIYKIFSSIVHFHYILDKLNRKFNLWLMKPSEIYFDKFYLHWRNNEEQNKLLFAEDCKYNLKRYKYPKVFLK